MNKHQKGIGSSTKIWIVTTAALFILAGSLHAVQTSFPLNRYDVILQRKPFGDVPPPPPPPPKAAEEVQTAPGPGDYLQKLRLCAMREMGGEGGPLRIGLVDDNVKPPKSYFLYVGDMMDGIEIVEASYNEKKALVKRDDEEYWLEIPTASMPPPAATAGSNGKAATRTAVATAMAEKAKAAPKKRRSYAERLRARREESNLKRLAVHEAKASVTKEELKKFFEEQQMEIIRRGMPALPIPLTKEMDDKLVEEGVLPPVEE